MRKLLVFVLLINVAVAYGAEERRVVEATKKEKELFFNLPATPYNIVYGCLWNNRMYIGTAYLMSRNGGLYLINLPPVGAQISDFRRGVQETRVYQERFGRLVEVMEPRFARGPASIVASLAISQDPFYEGVQLTNETYSTIEEGDLVHFLDETGA